MSSFYVLFETYGDENEVCEKKNTTDYKIVYKWTK